MRERQNEEIDPRVQNLIKWFDTYYVNGRVLNRNLRGAPRYTPPLFHPEIWSVYERTLNGLPRTQNKVEAWHRRWNTLVDGSHPGVFKTINDIKLEKFRTESEINRVTSGINPSHSISPFEIQRETYYKELIEN